LFVQTLSTYIFPTLFITILGYAICRRIPVFDVFLDGAANGLRSAINILPALVGLICAVSMLRASGALDFFGTLLDPILSKMGMPSEVLPLALLKSVSGSGSLAMIQDIFETNGADSYIGKVASVMLGSSETTFYALAVYYGSVKVQNTRYTVHAAIIADLVGIVAAVWITNLFF
jgi:spore maturation protein B